MFYFTVSKPGLHPVSGKQLSVLKAKAQQHCSSWRKKKGKWRWSGLISFVSRCIHFVFFPTPTSPLSVRPLIRNWTPQWQIEPAIKKRKRKALLSAADWDPRLPSHIRGVCSASKCVCVHVRVYLVHSQKPCWHNHLCSDFPLSPGVPTAYISAQSARQTKPNRCSCSPVSLTHVYAHKSTQGQPTYTSVTFFLRKKDLLSHFQCLL